MNYRLPSGEIVGINDDVACGASEVSFQLFGGEVVMAKLVVEVKSKIWLDFGEDPPTLECRLTNGSYVKVGYDMEYRHRLLWFSLDAEAEFVSATAAMTGLTSDQLAELEDEAYRAVEAYESNRASTYFDDVQQYAGF